MKRRQGIAGLVIGASFALLGLDAGPWTIRVANAETEYSSRNAITKVTGMPSIVAAGLMGAQGFSQLPFVPKDLPSLLTDCQRLSAPGTQWFSACDPDGMADSLTANFVGQHWVPRTFSGNGIRTKLDAINFIGGAVASTALQTPVAVPLFGRADHWMTVGKVRVDQDAGMLVTNLNWIYFYDAVPIADGAMNRAYNSDWTSGDDFGTSKYFKVLDVIGPMCPPCSDYYLGKYVLLYEPPIGMALSAAGSAIPQIHFTRAKGLLPKGETLTAERATRDVQRALALTTLPNDPGLREILRAGTPTQAYAVVGRLPDGGVRNYFVVPILDSQAQHALAFVEMDALDGAILNVALPSENFVFRPIGGQQATQLGMAHLKSGERLGEPTLRWDAQELHEAARMPFQAFFEIPVLGGDTPGTEVLRVALNGGIWIGRAPRAAEGPPLN